MASADLSQLFEGGLVHQMHISSGFWGGPTKFCLNVRSLQRAQKGSLSSFAYQKAPSCAAFLVGFTSSFLRNLHEDTNLAQPVAGVLRPTVNANSSMPFLL